MKLDIDQENKRPHSFTLKPSTIAMVREYAELKGTTMSKTVEAMIHHFLPKIIEQERKAQEQHYGH